MAAYDLEEQEQLEELKTWWRLHGNVVTGVMLAVALAFAGWQGWTWWQRAQHAEAAGVYTSIQEAVMKGDPKRARELAGTLIDQYSGTTYAALGVLLAARAQSDAGDLKAARPQLEWAVQGAQDDAARELARLRLVALLADEKAFEEAGKHLAAPPAKGFEVRHAELKGDVFSAQGKAQEAHAAYVAALELLEAQAKSAPESEKRGQEQMREFIKGKRDVAAATAPGEAK